MKNRQPQKVADADLAIDNYLQALLTEVEAYDPNREAVEPQERVVVETPPVIEEPVVEAPVAAVTNTVSSEEEPEVRAGEIIPAWAEAPFQCLMFKLDGVTLGIPLGSLQTIIEWDQEPSIVPGQPKWHLGILMNREAKVGIIDTATVIMPERISARLHGERQTGGFILVVGDGRWGLACDGIVSTEPFTKEMVRWRTGKGARPWLAGTAKDQLSAILDVEALLQSITVP